MTVGQFKDGVRRAIQFVIGCGLSKQAMLGDRPCTNAFVEVMFDSNYEKTFKAGIENADYNILMLDDSFFQFSLRQITGGNCHLRYAFYQSPRRIDDYETFLHLNGFSTNEIGDDLVEEYQQFLVESAIFRVPNPMRYELDHTRYKPLVHSLSHLHIGHESDIRIPISRVITPQAFVLFVLKHSYRKSFVELIQGQAFKEVYLGAKTICDELTNQEFSSDELRELHMA